jgi:predicted GTPase
MQDLLHGPRGAETPRSLPIVAIVGRPNAGKSTLFNRIIGERKAIVDDLPASSRSQHAETEWAGADIARRYRASEWDAATRRACKRAAWRWRRTSSYLFDGSRSQSADREAVNGCARRKPVFFAVNKLTPPAADNPTNLCSVSINYAQSRPNIASVFPI